MELSEYRNKLDSIDEEILRLFSERMNIAAEIASWKQENSLPVLDVRREKEKLQRIEEMSDPELSDYTFSLFSHAIPEYAPSTPWQATIAFSGKSWGVSRSAASMARVSGLSR